MDLVLLGDSILDNATYTSPHPDTAGHLCRLLGRTWRVALVARDGATMAGVPSQLERIPAGAAVGVMSIGGNDVLRHIGVLQRRASTAADVLDELATIAERFSDDYEALLDRMAGRFPRLIVCTIYEAPVINPAIARLARVPLSLLNDRIIRAAAARGVDVLELRTVCTTEADFTREIEPSAEGARRIAEAVAAAVSGSAGLRGARVLGLGDAQAT